MKTCNICHKHLAPFGPHLWIETRYGWSHQWCLRQYVLAAKRAAGLPER